MLFLSCFDLRMRKMTSEELASFEVLEIGSPLR
jgi:hypothetical protein